MSKNLTTPVTNPLVTEIVTARMAAILAMGRDEYAMRWLQTYRQRQKTAEAQP